MENNVFNYEMYIPKQIMKRKGAYKMVKLLVIADDFTGGLDTGVQFAVKGITVSVVTDVNINFSKIGQDIQVLVVVAETRHIDYKEAYDIVYRISARAKKAGIPYIFKKTDSALRGNIGSELAAVLDAAEETIMSFMPAFPKMQRVTVKGVQYVDREPLHESVFGQDPFEPATESDVLRIIGKQSNIETKSVSTDQLSSFYERIDKGRKMIAVFDSETDGHIYEAAKEMIKSGNQIMAGCAGLASVLPDLLEFDIREVLDPEFLKELLIVCGSVNPITRKQLDYAQFNGFARLNLDPRQKLEENFFKTSEGQRLVRQILKLQSMAQGMIIDTNDLEEKEATADYAIANGINHKEIRTRIMRNLGAMLEELIAAGLHCTMLVTGGDTLMGFMQQIGCDEIRPVCEMDTGVVLSFVHINDKRYPVITKSGGFGAKELLINIQKLINTKNKREDLLCQ